MDSVLLSCIVFLTRPEHICYQCLKKLKKNNPSVVPSRPNTFQTQEQGKVLSSPSTQHNQVQQGVPLLQVLQHVQGAPQFGKGQKSKLWRQTVFLPFSLSPSGNGKPHSMQLGQACRKTNTSRKVPRKSPCKTVT